MKMTYAEQLKHPNWQRKRLQVFEAYGFQCNSCGNKEKMLHVHHKKYTKGKAAWDYPVSNFEALCEDCHKEAHDDKGVLGEVIAAVPAARWMEAASILAMFYYDYCSDLLPDCIDVDGLEYGSVFSAIRQLGLDAEALVHVSNVIADCPKQFLRFVSTANPNNE